MRVVGLDLSLTATGVATEAATRVLRVKATGPGRLFELQNQVADHLNPRPSLVVVEGYSHASKFQAHQAGELGGVVRLLLWENSIPYADVPPTLLKKFATGKGNASKDEVLSAAVRAGFEGSDNNEADAWWLRQMGLYRYVTPGSVMRDYVVLINQYRDESVAKVAWPV